MQPKTIDFALSFFLAVSCCLIGSFFSGLAALQGMTLAGAKMPSPGGGSFDLGPLVYFVVGCLGGLVFSSLSMLVLSLKYGRSNPWSFLFALFVTPVLAGIVSAVAFSSSR